MTESIYKREKVLKAQGIEIRRATHFEAQRSPYGEKLIWVIDCGEWQALKAYPTKMAAIIDAEKDMITPEEFQRMTK